MTTDEIHEKIQSLEDWGNIPAILEHMNNKIAELERRHDDCQSLPEHDRVLLQCWKHKCDKLIEENESLKRELAHLKDDIKHCGIEKDLAD